MLDTAYETFQKQVVQKQFEDILKEFNELSEWVSKNWSDIQFTIEFNDDSQNPIQPSFKIKSRLFTGIDMSMGDRLLKYNTIVITPDIWTDNMLMMKFVKNIQPSFKKHITELCNNWYNERKAKLAAGLR